VRSGIDPTMVLSIAFTTCMSYLNSIPFIEMMFSNEGLSSQKTLLQARDVIVEFVIHGIMANPE
jgi:hypothetical protein